MSEEIKPEKRRDRRAKVARKLRIRPSDPDMEHFDDLLASTNVSKEGIYFVTQLPSYREGMRLFVTYPFTFENDPMKSEFLAEVVRVEELGGSKFGIAIRLMMSI